MERFPRLAIAFRLIRDSRFLYKKPRETQMGFQFIGNKSMETGKFEPEETKIAKKILKKVDVFINIGANIGYYSCMALKFEKKTVAFEPVWLNLKYLYKNVSANNWDDKIEIFPIALSNRTGIVNIYGGGTGASLLKGWAGISEQYRNMVPVSMLDIVLGKRFEGKRCFVLVDIEGAEKSMLEGACQFLAMDPKPIWMVEISTTEHQPEGVRMNPNLMSTFQLFWDNGYEAWTANHVPRHVSKKEIEDVCKGRKNIKVTQNFLFLEENLDISD